MCISICGKIIDLHGYTATVDVLGIEMDVNVELIEEPKLGDNLVIHSGYAIEKVSGEYSDEITRLLKEFDNE